LERSFAGEEKEREEKTDENVYCLIFEIYVIIKCCNIKGEGGRRKVHGDEEKMVRLRTEKNSRSNIVYHPHNPFLDPFR